MKLARLDIPYGEVISLLQKAEFFSRLLPDDLYWLASRSGVYAYPTGTVVFAPGEAADRFFIIRLGSVQVRREAADGRHENMAQFIDGDVLGDFDFARQARHDVHALAETTSSLLVFPDFGHTVDSLSSDRPDISARLLLRAVSMISSRVRSTQVLISENAPWVRELRRQMYTDAATGLWQRSYLDEELPRKVLRSAPVAFIFIKPDHFKELCDTFGHRAGDIAMVRIAEIMLAEASRLSGWAIRLRSNETGLVIPHCDEAKAVKIARSLVRSFSAIHLEDTLPECAFRFNASIGIGLWPRDQATLRTLADRTHACLMAAWQEGGNRIYRLSTVKDAQPTAAKEASPPSKLAPAAAKDPQQSARPPASGGPAGGAAKEAGV